MTKNHMAWKIRYKNLGKFSNKTGSAHHRVLENYLKDFPHLNSTIRVKRSC